jgi:hypothetical protein
MHHLHISLIFLLAVLIGCNAGPIIKSPVSLFPEDEPDRSLPVPNQDGANSTMVKISYKCETSSGSPTYDDVKGAVIKLTQKPKDKLCEQLNPGGSFCKKLVTHKGAAISICGEYIS